MPFKNGIDLCNSYHKELSSLAPKNYYAKSTTQYLPNDVPRLQADSS